MKNLQNLKGTHLLSKEEQQEINGGNHPQLCCDPALHCCCPKPFGGHPSNCRYIFCEYPCI